LNASENSLAKAIQTGTAFPKTGAKHAAARVEQLISCYPSHTPNDPQKYLTAVVAVLAEYPPEVVNVVCDPRTGIATRCKFLPTIAELTEALEREMEPHRKAWRDRYEQRTALPRQERIEPSEDSKERVRLMAADLFQEPNDQPPAPQRAQA
jgi:hypothetical protein